MKATKSLTAGATGALVLVLAACGGGTGFSDEGAAPVDTVVVDDVVVDDDATEPAQAAPGGGTELRVMIGTSGDAETQAVTDAIDAWSAATGNTAELQLASDLSQQLAQGFAAGSPPDVFYVSTEAFPGWAENGSLYPYGDQLGEFEFYQPLVDSFTYDGQFYCAPKDFSTLALVINDQYWADAGLTEADYPTTWEELESVAGTLTTPDHVGFSFSPSYWSILPFMAQAGGGLTDAAGNVAVDTPENLAALEFAQRLLQEGYAAFPSAINTGWEGEALGAGAAAMVINGNWIVGAMANDFPDVDYTIISFPEGPAGPGTAQFTNCWGIATDSEHKAEAVDFVKAMVADDQQMQFARDFGVMPSVSTVADQWAAEFPEQAAFIRGADYAQGAPAVTGIGGVISDFDAQLEGLQTASPATILSSVHGNLEEIMP